MAACVVHATAVELYLPKIELYLPKIGCIHCMFAAVS